MMPGWQERYERICERFGYEPRRDAEAALALDGMLDKPPDIKALQGIIRGRAVLCVGAGPTLRMAAAALGSSPMPVIAADSALYPLLRLGIKPDILVTDLDGQPECMERLARSDIVFVVHAHGDNIGLLHMAKSFQRCVGTTQGAPFGAVQNFGGFTDGDRAVFLASRFGARAAVLCGMDLGGPVSEWSINGRASRAALKLRKLSEAASLLEWLAARSRSSMYTLSYPLSGFAKIAVADVKNV